MWLADPRSSPAPHFDGQRALSAGGFQVWAPAIVETNNKAAANVPLAAATRFIVSSVHVGGCEGSDVILSRRVSGHMPTRA
jgi:hypothetical protein